MPRELLIKILEAIPKKHKVGVFGEYNGCGSIEICISRGMKTRCPIREIGQDFEPYEYEDWSSSIICTNANYIDFTEDAQEEFGLPSRHIAVV